MVDLVGAQVYEFDANGHLVRLEDESDQDYTIRTAKVLYDEGLSQNHPDDVAAQFSEAPTIESIDPSTVAIGSEDVDMHVTGSGFTESSVINFAGQEEPTTLNDDGTLSTIVKPSLWLEPVTVQCFIVTDGRASEPVDFQFT